MLPRRKPVLVCVDVETSGPRVSRNGILAIGIAVHFAPNHIVSYCYPALLEQGKVFDPVTLRCFWDKHTSLLEKLRNEAEPLKDALGRFLAALDYYDENFSVTLVLDNPAFDCAFLNDAMDRLFQRKGVCYALDKRFRMPIDMRSFGIGALHGEGAFQAFRSNLLAERGLVITHSPDQDCVVNLQVYAATLELVRSRKVRAAKLSGGGASESVGDEESFDEACEARPPRWMETSAPATARAPTGPGSDPQSRWSR